MMKKLINERLSVSIPVFKVFAPLPLIPFPRNGQGKIGTSEFLICHPRGKVSLRDKGGFLLK